jgi:predicted secreted protein
MSLSDGRRTIIQRQMLRIQSLIGAVRYLTQVVSDQADEIRCLKSDVGQLRSLR